MKNGYTSRMMIAIPYLLWLFMLLYAGMQAIPSRQSFKLEYLQLQPRFSDSNVPVYMTVDEEDLP
jgi:hypothetical protein